MNTHDVRATLDALHATDPDDASADDVAALVTAVTQVRGWLDAYEVRCARRTRSLAAHGDSQPAASVFTQAGQRSSREAARIAERDAVCDRLDQFEGALADGQISVGHLDSASDAMRNLDDDIKAHFADAAPELLEVATTTSVDAFARQCRDLARHLVATRSTSDSDELDRQRANVKVKRWVDKVTGMHHTTLELDPLRDAAVWSGIDAHLARLRAADGNAHTPWNQLQADAVVAAIGNSSTRRPAGPASPTGPSGDDGDGDGHVGNGDDGNGHVGVDTAMAHADDTAHALRVPEITVVVDYSMLLDGYHEHGICETDDGTALPVSTVRRLCCDAEIIPVVLGADGVPLDVGRSVRTANRAQRRALRSMHRTCGHPECTIGFSQCKIHHIRWWWRDNGPTDLANLIPLCERHHHLVHEGRWTLTMTPDRVATWTRPDGTVHHTGTCIDRGPPTPIRRPATPGGSRPQRPAPALTR